MTSLSDRTRLKSRARWTIAQSCVIVLMKSIARQLIVFDDLACVAIFCHVRSPRRHRQILHLAGPGELVDQVERGFGDLLIRADAIDPAREHQPLIEGGVSGEKRRGLILHDDRDVIRRVAWRRDGDDVADGGQAFAG